jgi:hypothetical protein
MAWGGSPSHVLAGGSASGLHGGPSGGVGNPDRGPDGRSGGSPEGARFRGRSVPGVRLLRVAEVADSLSGIIPHPWSSSSRPGPRRANMAIRSPCGSPSGPPGTFPGRILPWACTVTVHRKPATSLRRSGGREPPWCDISAWRMPGIFSWCLSGAAGSSLRWCPQEDRCPSPPPWDPSSP